jgi:cation diffusion facilitator CzcD-associated flavoprotein CzcO
VSDITTPRVGGSRFHVAVIGAGVSGIYLAESLRRYGIDFTIFEKADEIGGTWRDNTYPGLHVDVITRSYEFPFARNRTWSKRYAPGSEIQQYLLRVANELGIRERIRFGTEIVSADYEEGTWSLLTSDGEQHSADAVVSATGFLRDPLVPRMEGLEDFAGPVFHSAAWDHSVDLTGKRIGVVGTGSSGIQIVTELGKRGHDVTHFMRTPQWIQVKPNPTIRAYERFLLRFPVLGRYWDWRMRRLKIRDDGSENWRLEPGPERDEITRRFLEVLEQEVPDPELRAQLTPDYQVGCKRIPKSPDFYRVIQQDNVHPVFGGISRVEPSGVITTDGEQHEIDVFVLATGYDAHSYMRPMKVTGTGGVTVDELWSDYVYSYRGVALPSMPNFFLLSGPFAPVNSVAIPQSLQVEVEFLLSVFERSRKEGVALAPTVEATSAFTSAVADALPRTTYAECHNWYMDKGGVPVIWPWTREKHRQQFLEVRSEEFETYVRQDGNARQSRGVG